MKTLKSKYSYTPNMNRKKGQPPISKGRKRVINFTADRGE
jgi:hypothetical protein